MAVDGIWVDNIAEFSEVCQILKGEKLKKWGGKIKVRLDPSVHYGFKAISRFTGK